MSATSETSGAGRYIRGVASGVAFLVVALLLAWAASSDRTPVSWIAPYAFFITLAWWIAITLGVAKGISSAGRVSAGVVIAVAAVPMMVVSMGLMQRVGTIGAAFGDYSLWQSAAITVLAPWLFGTGFGWSMVSERQKNRRPISGL